MRFWRNFNLMPVVRAILFVLVTMVLPGCIILDGSAGSSGDHTSGSGTSSGGAMMGGPAPMACPRAPDLGGTSPPMLSADELVRANELCQWKIALYEKQGWTVLYTVQMPSGDIYDYLDMSGVPASQEQPPPPPALTLPPGFGFVQSELGLHPELAGPKGTQLRVRPDFSRYISGNTGAASVDEFIKLYLVPGTPTGGGRLYAGISSTNNPANNPTYNEGAGAWVMPYAGPIPPGTMSLLEMAVGCRNLVDKVMYQQIGIAAARDYADPRFRTTNDSMLRLQVEFLTASDLVTGEGKGGWAGTVSMHDFKPYPPTGNPWAPGMLLYPSMVGGPGFVSHFQIQHMNKRWWVGINGIWIGSYDEKLFDWFSKGACEALWYSEGYNPGYDPAFNPIIPAPKWPPVGSGHYAAEGLAYASYFLGPFYYDSSMVKQWPDKGGTVGPSNPGCYTTTGLINLPPPFDHIVFVGGPGGDAPNNACPSPAPPLPPPPPQP